MNRAYLAAALLYMAAIFALSSLPGSAAGIPPPWDKLAHFLEYAVLGFLLGRGTGRFFSALAIAALYGASDELHQAFVPGREASALDWAADLLGALAGAALSRPPAGASPRRR